MSEGVSFDEGLSGENGSMGRQGSSMKGGMYGGPGGPKKSMTEWLAEKLNINEAGANILQIVFAVAIFALAGFIFWSAIKQ